MFRPTVEGLSTDGDSRRHRLVIHVQPDLFKNDTEPLHHEATGYRIQMTFASVQARAIAIF